MNIPVDEFGRPIIQSGPVYAVLSGSRLKMMLKANTRAALRNLLELIDLIETVDDGEGGTRKQLVAGVDVCDIGSVVLVPAVLDTDGETVITPPVMDDSYHINVWLDLNRVDRSGNWTTFLRQWRDDGIVGAPNKVERIFERNGISLIDPSSIASHRNVML